MTVFNRRFDLDQQYPRLLAAAGIDADAALRAAGQPEDAFAHERPTMSAAGYFAFMEAVGRLAPEPGLAVRLAAADGVEQASPPVFAASCSPDGRTFLARIARYKRLIGPMEMRLDEGGLVDSASAPTDPAASHGAPATTAVEYACEEAGPIPPFLVECEVVFLVGLLRRATGRAVVPAAVDMRTPPTGEERTALEGFLGAPVSARERDAVVLLGDDLAAPFVTRNEVMWDFIEPELSRRLSELDVDDSIAARVRAALVEMLPAGQASIDGAAARLGLSSRTVQRRLREEGTSFQAQLAHTRELLATHYLRTTAMGVDEIAYLLGYLETNSFTRAFQGWTGRTPAAFRREERGGVQGTPQEAARG